LIRELHVYGQAVRIGSADSSKSQHKGYGKRLMEQAESIAKEHGKDKMIVMQKNGTFFAQRNDCISCARKPRVFFAP